MLENQLFLSKVYFSVVLSNLEKKIYTENKEKKIKNYFEKPQSQNFVFNIKSQTKYKQKSTTKKTILEFCKKFKTDCKINIKNNTIINQPWNSSGSYQLSKSSSDRSSKTILLQNQNIPSVNSFQEQKINCFQRKFFCFLRLDLSLLKQHLEQISYLSINLLLAFLLVYSNFFFKLFCFCQLFVFISLYFFLHIFLFFIFLVILFSFSAFTEFQMRVVRIKFFFFLTDIVWFSQNFSFQILPKTLKV